MKKHILLSWLVLAMVVLAPAAFGDPVGLVFERVKISDAAYEAASVCDMDRDGHPDIVSGAYWYAGPGFATKVKFHDPAAAGEYFDDFLDYPLDVNGDGYPDIITGGYFGPPLRWLENPKTRDGVWIEHRIDACGSIETARFWDVDGDGVVEACPNAGGNVIFYRLVRDEDGRGTGAFTKHVVKKGGCGHGLGFGDVNGDGRGDFITPDGWLEAPADPLTGSWAWRPEFRLGLASVPILVHDVNQDGAADLIVGQGHGYGLHWWEQGTDAEGKRTWTQHLIEDDLSQLHDMMLADLDNDGQDEMITGKRYRAHNGHDPGSEDPVGVHVFSLTDGRFKRTTIEHGPAATHSGLGIYFWVEDVDGNGWKDIVAPGKEGLYLFKNLGRPTG